MSCLTPNWQQANLANFPATTQSTAWVGSNL
jgi:hypothetical protein